MKRTVHVDEGQYARIRRQVLEDELHGRDSGAYWARIYPGASSIEFVVVPSSFQTPEHTARAIMRMQGMP